MTITHDALGHEYTVSWTCDLSTWTPATDIRSSSLETFSNLFIWEPTPSPQLGLPVATETRMVGKRAVSILLEWCLLSVVSTLRG